MSAIFGLQYFDQRPASSAELERMGDVLAHRGPDGAHVWCEGPVGLGHRMLRTTPESLKERLPLRDAESGMVITADARLDNREELIRHLGSHGLSLGMQTDSEIILAGYKHWGERCPEKLLGDFAFVIWDPRKQWLFCARDHFGVKPLYYYFSPGRTFVFATEIKGLWPSPQVPRELNRRRLADHLADISLDPHDTFYREILRLPAAHVMTVRPGNLNVSSYWSLDRSREIRLKTQRDYAEAFRDLFFEAVRCRLRSAFPIGSMLSGGLDSSSVVCVARQLLEGSGTRLATFSGVFDDVPQCDERPYINKVLAQNGVDPHFIAGDRQGPFKHMKGMLWHADQAFFAPNFAMVWAIYEAAQKSGTRVLLDGHDGDTTVSYGYKFLDELASSGRWLRLIKELRWVSQREEEPFWSLFRDFAGHYGADPLIRKYAALRAARRTWQRAARRLRRAPDQTSEGSGSWRDLLNPRFIAETSLEKRYKDWKKTLWRATNKEREAHYRRLTQPLQALALEIHNGAAAAFSLEPRYPFWDKRLVEFCLALPPEQKLQRGWPRMIMRRALDGILPPAIQWRPGKTNFAPNLAHGLRVFEREQLDEIIMHRTEVLSDYINVSSVRQTYRRFLDGETSDNAIALFALWKVGSLGLWLQNTTQDQ